MLPLLQGRSNRALVLCLEPPNRQKQSHLVLSDQLGVAMMISQIHSLSLQENQHWEKRAFLVNWIGVTSEASHPFLLPPQARVLSNTRTLCAARKRNHVAEKERPGFSILEWALAEMAALPLILG